MKNILFSLLVFLIFIGMDWILIDGFKNSLTAFRDVPKEYNYKRFLFPRIFIILLSALLFYFSSRTDFFGQCGFPLIFVAMGIFFLSSLYPQVVMFLRSRAYID